VVGPSTVTCELPPFAAFARAEDGPALWPTLSCVSPVESSSVIWKLFANGALPVICAPLLSYATIVSGLLDGVPSCSGVAVSATVATTPRSTTLKWGELPAAIVNVAFAVASTSFASSRSEKVYATVPVGAGIATVQVSPDALAVQFPPLPVESVTTIGLIFAIAGGSVELPSIDVMSTESFVVFGDT